MRGGAAPSSFTAQVQIRGKAKKTFQTNHQKNAQLKNAAGVFSLPKGQLGLFCGSQQKANQCLEKCDYSHRWVLTAHNRPNMRNVRHKTRRAPDHTTGAFFLQSPANPHPSPMGVWINAKVTQTSRSLHISVRFLCGCVLSLREDDFVKYVGFMRTLEPGTTNATPSMRKGTSE